MTVINSIAKWLNYLLGFLLLCAIGYILFLMFNPKIERVYIQAKPTIKIVYVERQDSTTVAKTTIPQTDFAEEMVGLEKTKEMYERLIPEIQDYKKQVAVLTEIRSNLEGQLTEKDIVIGKLGKSPINTPNGATKDDGTTTWKGEYMTVTHTPQTKSIDYQYRNILQLAITRDKSRSDSVSVFASSPDKNNKINGMDTYVQKFIIPKRFSELVADASVSKMNLNNDWGNVNNYMIDGKLKWRFNPDGKLRPYIHIGASTDFNRVAYPFGIGTEYKIK